MTLGLLMVGAQLGLLWARRLSYATVFLASEGVLLSIMVVVFAGASFSGEDLAVAGLTLAIKAGLIPWAVHQVNHQLPRAQRMDRPLPFWAYIIAAFLVIMAGHVVAILSAAHMAPSRALLLEGLIVLQWAFLMMISRRHVLAQVIALVSAENGVVVIAAALTSSLPLFLEIATLFDIALAVWVLLWLSRQLQMIYQTNDSAALQRLRG
ncbi:MAG: hypothetical protein OWS74_00340 [Firmicutes bacterium]|nr:hypothetical protein [Bacillota bacterium]